MIVHICSLDERFLFYPIGRHTQQVIRKLHPYIFLSRSTKDRYFVYSRLLFSAGLNKCLIIQINADLIDSLRSFTKHHTNNLKCAFSEVSHKYISLPGWEIHLKISGLLPNDGCLGISNATHTPFKFILPKFATKDSPYTFKSSESVVNPSPGFVLCLLPNPAPAGENTITSCKFLELKFLNQTLNFF